MLLASNSGNISFGSTLVAGASSYANEQSLTLSAPNGQVSFGDTVGASVIASNGQYIPYTTAYFSDPNIYDLTVTASTILIKANITTFGTQTYNGAVRIGDNGTNGLTRILLSEDPAIIFNGTVDDTLNGSHNLVVEAIAINSAQVPAVTFTEAVGSIAQLASLYVKTGEQNTSSGAVITDISIDPTNYVGNITIAGNISTTGNQTYTTNTVALGNSALPNASQVFATNGGIITFNLGQAAGGGITNTGLAPVGFMLNGGSVVGLGGSGLSYQLLATPQPISLAVSAPPPYQMIAAGTAAVSMGNLISYGSIAGSGGAVTVSEPVLESVNPTATTNLSAGGNGNGVGSSVNNLVPTITSVLGSASTTGASNASSVAQIQLGGGAVQTVQSTPLGGSGFTFTVPQGVINNISASAPTTASVANTATGSLSPVITATLADGSPLPSWISFDSVTQTFAALKVPDNAPALVIKLQAKQGGVTVGESVITIAASR